MEALGQMTRVSGDRPMSFNVAIHEQRIEYGQAIGIVQGVHVDFLNSLREPGFRRLHLIMGYPFPTISLSEMTAQEAISMRARTRRMLGYDEQKKKYRDQMIVPANGQYTLLQELSPHCAADTRDIKSYEDAQRLFGDQPDVMRWFREDHYMRLFVTAQGRFEEDRPGRNYSPVKLEPDMFKGLQLT